MNPSEKVIETAIVNYLRSIGVWCQKVHSGAVLQTYTTVGGTKKTYKIKLADEGTPDILACIKGKFVGIEVKKNEKEKQKWEKGSDQRSRAQQNQRNMIVEAKGIYLLVCSLPDLYQDLAELGLVKPSKPF